MAHWHADALRAEAEQDAILSELAAAPACIIDSHRLARAVGLVTAIGLRQEETANHDAQRTAADALQQAGVIARTAVVRESDGVESCRGQESGVVRGRIWTSAETAQTNGG